MIGHGILPSRAAFSALSWAVGTAIAALAASGCHDHARHDGAAAPDTPIVRGPAAAPHDGATAPGAEPQAAGPCRGKRAGETACDGSTLVRCDAGEGAVTRLRSCLDVERCDAEHSQCAPACPSGEVYVPPTSAEGFTMGRGKVPYGFGPRKSGNEGHGIADIPHQVVLSKPFCMDATEVTVGAYEKCVAEGECTKPDFRTHWIVYPDKADYPVNMVDWRQAKHYCDFAGKSLPTEAQWEWAASGGDGRKWPWGDTPPTCDLADFTPGDLTAPACDCGCNGGGASPVATHPDGDTEWPSGKIHDLAGNVWEWCLDNYAAYKSLPQTDPVYLTSEDASHVVRGGGWNRSAKSLVTSFRGTAVVEYQRPALGFRCVRNAG
jgi:formylglycine-generating enzyme required for sulfatase activity